MRSAVKAEPPPSVSDRRWMRKALGLAARARGRTAPNPLVGAVLVKDDRLIASGHHRAAGALHAEAVALQRAGAAARGSTLYVTLEPCTHQGRTPPCIDAVLGAQLSRVVVGMRDPDPRVAGRGLRKLRAAGIDVAVGVEDEACRELNCGYLSRVKHKRPFTRLKLAATLDGRIATRSGDSRWISGESALRFVHRLRNATDTIVVGSNTVLADDPALTARRGTRVVHRPRVAVVDSKLRVPTAAKMIIEAEAAPWVLTTRGTKPRKRRALEAAGAELIDVKRKGDHLDLRAAWARLAELGVNDLLVEGGGGLAAALLKQKLVDRFYLILAPKLIGADGLPMMGPLGIERLRDALTFERFETRKLGQDLLLFGEC